MENEQTMNSSQDHATAKVKLERLKVYLKSLMKTSDVESEILESIRSESIKRSSDATKVDTYFYIQSKKFRSNKEVARFLNLLPPKVKSNNNKGIFVEKDHEEIEVHKITVNDVELLYVNKKDV